MRLGIIFAMEEELKAFKDFIEIEKEYEIFDLKFYEGSFKNITCILVESGVGKVNASRATQILIDNMQVDFIFNIGVAGGVSNDLDVLDIVIADKLVQHDFDITAFNHEKGYIPNVGTFISADTYLLNVAKSLIDDDSYKIGVIASGDIFCTEKKMSEKINQKFQALGVEMEVRFNLNDNKFVGFIDYVGEKDGDIYIIDNKSRKLKPRSRRKKPTVNDNDLDSMLRQLYLYAAAVKQEYGAFPKWLCFNCFRNNVFIKELFDEDKYNETLEWANKTIEEIKNAKSFYPSVEFFKCRYLCGYNNICCYASQKST